MVNSGEWTTLRATMKHGRQVIQHKYANSLSITAEIRIENAIVFLIHQNKASLHPSLVFRQTH